MITDQSPFIKRDSLVCPNLGPRGNNTQGFHVSLLILRNAMRLRLVIHSAQSLLLALRTWAA